jgi:hypothetical protein
VLPTRDTEAEIGVATVRVVLAGTLAAWLKTIDVELTALATVVPEGIPVPVINIPFARVPDEPPSEVVRFW